MSCHIRWSCQIGSACNRARTFRSRFGCAPKCSCIENRRWCNRDPDGLPFARRHGGSASRILCTKDRVRGSACSTPCPLARTARSCVHAYRCPATHLNCLDRAACRVLVHARLLPATQIVSAVDANDLVHIRTVEQVEGIDGEFEPGSLLKIDRAREADVPRLKAVALVRIACEI